MSQQLSECPNCGRTFIGNASSRRGSGRCRICGTPLLAMGNEKEAEVRERLYGPYVSLASVTRLPAHQTDEG